MSLCKTVLFVRIVLTNNVSNVKQDKAIKAKDALSPGEPVTMLTILTASLNGRVKRKLNAPFVKVSGIQLKRPNNEEMIIFTHHFK